MIQPKLRKDFQIHSSIFSFILKDNYSINQGTAEGRSYYLSWKSVKILVRLYRNIRFSNFLANLLLTFKDYKGKLLFKNIELTVELYWSNQ